MAIVGHTLKRLDRIAMQVIGLCRFSYPALGGFQVEHDDIEARIRYLYQSKRLEERFRLFETVTLPGLRAQTDQEFILAIVIGDSLPARHRDRLHDLAATLPQARILSRPPGLHRPVMKDILHSLRGDRAQPCLQFRQDDDDAVAVDFVENLRAATEDCAGLILRHNTVAIDFNRGYIAEFGAGGIAAHEEVRSLNVAALGMYVSPGCNLTIMNFAHHKMARFMPVVSYTDTPMWVRSHNGFNDSRNERQSKTPVAPLTTQQQAEFASRFEIHDAEVRRAFGQG